MDQPSPSPVRKTLAILGFVLVAMVCTAYLATMILEGLPLSPSEEVGNHGSWHQTWYRRYYFHSLFFNFAGMILSAVSIDATRRIATWSLILGGSALVGHFIAFLPVFD